MLVPKPGNKESTMSVTDYIIDILLIVVIFRQIRPHQLTLRVALLPVVLLVAAGAIYLRPPFTTGGHDLQLIAILAAGGIVLGTVSGLGDRIWRDGGELLARAGVLSVAAWVIGMGFRFGFAYYAYHTGGPAIARFSVRHDITGASTWTTALFVMAAGQVLARLAVLQVRRIAAANTAGAVSDRLSGTAQTSR
jgi:hypothetical protein